MKITFDLVNCGLGNNGGSLTIVESAVELAKLGNIVTIIDSGRNKLTWTDLGNVDHIIIKDERDIPDADVIVATGYKTVSHVCSLPRRCGIKFHWLRGWETWNYPEELIISKILNTPTIKVVNGICLQEKLEKYNYSSYLIRPGYDIWDYFPLEFDGQRMKDVFIIGGLYNEGKKRSGKRTDWIFKCYEKLKDKDRFVQLFMFGSEGKPSNVNCYHSNPDPELKNKIYNMCSVWLAPTELEGLHIAPAEAMLTNCPVIGTNAEMSGMKDYLINGVNGLVSQNDFDSFYQVLVTFYSFWKANKLIDLFEERPRHTIMNLGTRRDNMIKFVELFQKILGD